MTLRTLVVTNSLFHPIQASIQLERSEQKWVSVLPFYWSLKITPVHEYFIILATTPAPIISPFPFLETTIQKYQLHQHKGVCYRQVATHPITACFGGANV